MTDRKSDNTSNAAAKRSPVNGTQAFLCLPLGVVAAALLAGALSFPVVLYPWLVGAWPELRYAFARWPVPPLFVVWQWIVGISSIYLLLAALAGATFRQRWSLYLVRKAYGIVYLLVALYALFTMIVTSLVSSAMMALPEPPADGYVRELFYWRFEWLWPAVVVLLLTIIQHVVSWRRSTVNLFCRQEEDAPLPGDRVWENVRTHGRDPDFRKSVYGSSFAHLLVIVLIPLLLMMRGGCIRPYRVPLGSGQPAVAMVKVVKPKKKKRRKYILSDVAAISLALPDLDDSEVVKDVNDATQLTYVADTSAAHGNMGTGGGQQAGWADGFGDGEIRFIRVEYSGEEWDDGMDKSEGADANFLAAFQELSGLDSRQVARDGESHPVSHLRKYPKGEAPPFIYMTGSGNLRLSRADMETLREYIKEGGMIFGDAGSRRWDGQFRSMANTLLPGSPLRPIADDDPIF